MPKHNLFRPSVTESALEGRVVLSQNMIGAAALSAFAAPTANHAEIARPTDAPHTVSRSHLLSHPHHVAHVMGRSALAHPTVTSHAHTGAAGGSQSASALVPAQGNQAESLGGGSATLSSSSSAAGGRIVGVDPNGRPILVTPEGTVEYIGLPGNIGNFGGYGPGYGRGGGPNFGGGGGGLFGHRGIGSGGERRGGF